jgi:hypothetical protein
LLGYRTVLGDRGIARGAAGALAGAGGGALSLIFVTATARQGQRRRRCTSTHQLQCLLAGHRRAVGKPLGRPSEVRARSRSVFSRRHRKYTDVALLLFVHGALALSPERLPKYPYEPTYNTSGCPAPPHGRGSYPTLACPSNALWHGGLRSCGTPVLGLEGG